MAGRDARPLMPAILRAFGVDAVVTRPAPDDDPIETTGVWVPVDSSELPQGSDFDRIQEIHCIGFDVDEVPTLPRGSLIQAPKRRGGTVLTWVVDGLLDRQSGAHAVDADQVKAIVQPYLTG